MSPSLPEQLSSFGVVPVVAIKDAAQAVPLADALLAGGLLVVEVTFRTDAAPEAIRAIVDGCPDIFVGAGTLLSAASVDAAVRAGASFGVTPGFSPAVVERALELGLPLVPGVNSPTGVEQGLSYGLTLLKFFPAVASGGLPMIKALAGPYSHVSFMPTGGITLETASEWLSQPNVVAVGGTWIASTAAISGGDFAAITSRAAAARRLSPATSH